MESTAVQKWQAMEVSWCLLLFLDGNYNYRLWSQHPPNRQWESLLHVVRSRRHSALSHHVPKCGWTPEHICDFSSQTHKKMPQAEKLRGLADKLNNGGYHSVQLLLVYWSRCLHPLWGLVLFGCILLLLHYTNYHWIRRLCGSAE